MRILFISFGIIWAFLFNPVLANDANITPRIIGGTTAKSTAWPWMAALIDLTSKRSNDFFCGGSLIAPNWIVTAAHCVQDQDIGSFELIINSTRLDSWTATHLTPKAIVIHPRFNNKQLINDIALIQLTNSISVSPIQVLPEFSIQDDAGRSGIALGWGNTSVNDYVYPSSLQQVELPIISNQKCQQSMSGILDTMLCAGSELGGKDTCDGDSGGPLVVFDAESLSWRLAGLTSFGESACAEKGSYGVYTRLDKYNDFISNTICKANDIPPPPFLALKAKVILPQLIGQHQNSPLIID